MKIIYPERWSAEALFEDASDVIQKALELVRECELQGHAHETSAVLIDLAQECMFTSADLDRHYRSDWPAEQQQEMAGQFAALTLTMTSACFALMVCYRHTAARLILEQAENAEGGKIITN